MPNLTNDDILDAYPLVLQANIQELLLNGVGLAQAVVHVNLPPHKINNGYEVDYGNSLMVDVPYAGKYLQWEIMFNDEDLEFAPDFSILNDPFLSDPDVDTIEAHLTTLINWDIGESKSLLNFVMQLRDLYKKHQLEKFLNDSKYALLHDEFLQLKAQLNLQDNDLEVTTENNAQYILLPLKLDYSELPVYIQKTYFPDGITMNPGNDRTILKMGFYQRRNMATLQFSPRLEAIFSMYSTLHIPQYKRDSLMVEYVQSVQQLIKERIEDIKMHFNKKENYISVLLSLHGDNVHEYDNIAFTTATFLFDTGSFACMGQIYLNERFPHEAPVVTLRSMYHKNAQGMPASLTLKSYPYHPEWEVEEMVDKLLMHIRNEMTKFKSHCINNLSL